MLKEINWVTQECIRNKTVDGCATEIGFRLYEYLRKMLEEDKEWSKVIITFETKY